MKRLWLGLGLALGSCLLMGAADGAWLRRVPTADRARLSPLPDKAAAAQAGSHLYANNCATCHGAEGLGKPGRPPVLSDRVEQATDGELAWLLKNGSPWKGMPSWNQLPTAQRWQLVAYLRRINTPVSQTAGSTREAEKGSKQ